MVAADLRWGDWLTPPKSDDYHFTTDMTDQAIGWVRSQQSLQPDKPFFMYYAPGAMHAPHHVPQRMGRRVQGQVRRGMG